VIHTLDLVTSICEQLYHKVNGVIKEYCHERASFSNPMGAHSG